LTPFPGTTILQAMARLYSLAEANALLPRLREILTAIQQAVAALEQTQEAAAGSQLKLRRNGHGAGGQAAPSDDDARQVLQERLRELDELGVELKDPRTGLVDFQSRRDGEIVYLCWKLDEPTVGWWHTLESGFAGRRQL
jgi:hypothetical protein